MDENKTAGSGEGPGMPDAALKQGLQAGAVGVWRWDVATDRLVWSENLPAIHHLPSGLFDGTFASFARDIHADDRERVMAEIQEVLRSGDRYRVQYRLPGGADGVRWLEARGAVLRDAAGRPTAMSGICQDITSQKETELELALRARQHEAVAALGEMAIIGNNLQQLLQEASAIVADLAEADFSEILEIAQDRGSFSRNAGFGWGDAEIPAAIENEASNLAGFTIAAGSAVIFTDMGEEERFRLPPHAEAAGIRSGACVTVGGRDGRPFGVVAIYCRRQRCIAPTDVRFLQSVANVLGSAVRTADDHERKELLIGELRHRVGNLFSLVQALHRQTGQSAHDAADLEMKFGARLAALASAHAMILDGGWQKTALRALLETALAPYIDRVSFSGPDIHITADAAFSLSMALHELATNASKYGALSSPNGRLSVDCRLLRKERGSCAEILWNEHDGPAAPEPEGDGFGSRLIHQVVERQLGGSVERRLEADGLRMRLEIPL